jgi:Ion channel
MIWHRIRRTLTEFWLSIVGLHREYVRFVCSYPFILLILIPIYVLVAMLAAGVCVGLAYVTECLLYPDWTAHNFWRDISSIHVLYLLIYLCLVMGISLHYLFLTFKSFLSATSVDVYNNPILRVVQLVAITVIYFAAIHYYVALLSDRVAYAGMIGPMPKDGWPYYFDWPNKILFIPSIETVVDCVYFSTVTMATLGYGDIHPATMIAKIATMAEIFFSFGLIVVVLGWVIGHAKAFTEPNPLSPGLTSLGGSGMTDAMARYSAVTKPNLTVVDDTAAISHGLEARVAEIKHDLKQWLDHAHDPADGAAISLALLETAFERYLDNFQAPEAFEMIEAVFRRAVRRRRDTLQ